MGVDEPHSNPAVTPRPCRSRIPMSQPPEDHNAGPALAPEHQICTGALLSECVDEATDPFTTNLKREIGAGIPPIAAGRPVGTLLDTQHIRLFQGEAGAVMAQQEILEFGVVQPAFLGPPGIEM